MEIIFVVTFFIAGGGGREEEVSFSETPHHILYSCFLECLSVLINYIKLLNSYTSTNIVLIQPNCFEMVNVENKRTLREVGVKIRLRWDKNRLLVRQEKASL